MGKIGLQDDSIRVGRKFNLEIDQNFEEEFIAGLLHRLLFTWQCQTTRG